MLEYVTRFVQPIIPIRHHEWRKAILMFFQFFFALASYYILRSVKDSLFISTHGSENLWYAYVGEGGLLIFVTFFYVWLARVLSRKNVFFSVATAFFVLNTIAFWFLFKAGYTERLAYIFYIWVAAYSITIVTQCWTLANDIFDPQEAKRLFGFIASGASLGGIVGGLVTNRAVKFIGTENLLLMAAGLLAACIFLINAVWAQEESEQRAEKTARPSMHFSPQIREKASWALLFGSRYLLLIVALVGIAKIASTLVDNQFKAVVQNAIVSRNDRTAFFGQFWAYLNGVSFFLQLVIASKILRRFGIGISLLLLPLGLCLGSALTLFYPVLLAAAFTKMYDGSFNYSINQLGKEMLYLPIPSRIRYRVKPLIDMLSFRASKSIAGLLIFLMMTLLGISDEKLGLVVLLLIPLWILAVWGVRDEYMQAIKRHLSSRKKSDPAAKASAGRAQEVLGHFEGERSYEQLKEFIGHRSSVTRKMSAAACLAFYSSARDVRRVRKLAEEMIRYEALELKGIDLERPFQESPAHRNGLLDQYLSNLLKANQDPHVDSGTLLRKDEKEVLLKITDCLDDPHEEVSGKRKAILILTALGTQGAVDILLSSLGRTQDRSLRFNLIQALNRIRARGKEREFSPWMIKREIGIEVKNYHAILTASQAYRKKKISRPEEDYLLATLQAIQEESMERLFRLLALLYSSDTIHVIYDRLIELEPDRHVKANALELLENVVEPELAQLVRPIFDEFQRVSAGEKDLEESVHAFLESGDRWLSVCAVFLILELGLNQFYPMLAEMAHSRIPIVREAAEIALLKAGQKDKLGAAANPSGA